MYRRHTGEGFSVTDREPERKKRIAGDDEIRTHSEDGVDLTLIHWMLSLSPAERLMVLQNNIRSLKGLTDAASKP